MPTLTGKEVEKTVESILGKSEKVTRLRNTAGEGLVVELKATLEILGIASLILSDCYTILSNARTQRNVAKLREHPKSASSETYTITFKADAKR